MIRLSLEEILLKIENRECFVAVVDDYSFTLKIDKYEPYVCGAVHDGHQFRKALWNNCKHSEYDRWYEEDPCTKEMVDEHPIVIAGCDSRFEYDLNRSPESAVYTDAWGKKLWKNPLSEKEKKISLLKHSNFYKVVYKLISVLEQIHGKCVVYDIHSYNWKRWERKVPTWNLGTANIDQDRFVEEIENWRQSLSEINLPNEIISDAKINDTFQGNGYFLKYITQNFKNTLVLATEIKKIYCDELSQVIYPEVVAAIKKELKVRIEKHSTDFMKK
ncbi:N-formylglutamate amidohydrolase [Pseudofulvibacter geojedonensis]|uniref:N-formylglutamate amidohydrolase n=1 Tax=Pseudofulvibacter geojedonensis TaxID=1123758 RepID=A0ABW3I2W1_9FLAO